MARNSLEAWSPTVRSSWGPLTTSLVEQCRRYLARLASTSPSEEWLSALHREKPATQELYRDAEHGFMLIAHTEEPGLYRPPHDHGASWVMYAVLQGEMEMRTYASVPADGGAQRLVRRDVTRVLPGQVQIYLPGDIHDTRCIRGPALLLRFTERDLRIEKEQHRLRRFPSPDDLPISEAA